MKTKSNHPAVNSKITDQPAIYVGTYAKYNSGSIDGAWIDLTLINSHNEFYSLCADLHEDEDDPEFMFQDWQSIPDEYISESWLSEDFFEYQEAMNDLSDNEKEAYKAYVSLTGKKDIEDFREAYQGEYDSDEDFAEEVADQLGLIDHNATWPQSCIDWEQAARELMMDYQEQDGFYFRL